jgi:hypothetical protein
VQERGRLAVADLSAAKQDAAAAKTEGDRIRQQAAGLRIRDLKEELRKLGGCLYDLWDIDCLTATIAQSVVHHYDLPPSLFDALLKSLFCPLRSFDSILSLYLMKILVTTPCDRCSAVHSRICAIVAQ